MQEGALVAGFTAFAGIEELIDAQTVSVWNSIQDGDAEPTLHGSSTGHYRVYHDQPQIRVISLILILLTLDNLVAQRLGSGDALVRGVV